LPVSACIDITQTHATRHNKPLQRPAQLSKGTRQCVHIKTKPCQWIVPIKTETSDHSYWLGGREINWKITSHIEV